MSELIDDDAIVACPECSRPVYAARLCECEADNPLCPLCHSEWHVIDRMDAA